ncbi:response regulator transcription factor [Enterobacter oligotrophicus]|uniref:response regulator transcription factor n=1 Tax=Enterobacter oligotrophicus TaxID=2478464 RepID=UPI0012606201|nr:response regulator transcription factor [Enterobacter oligotrophicus]
MKINFATFLNNAGHEVDVVHDITDERRRCIPPLLCDDPRILPADSVQMLRGWRKNHTRLPLLALTDSDSAAKRSELLDTGTDDCKGLPVNIDELLARLCTIIRRCCY